MMMTPSAVGPPPRACKRSSAMYEPVDHDWTSSAKKDYKKPKPAERQRPQLTIEEANAIGSRTKKTVLKPQGRVTEELAATHFDLKLDQAKRYQSQTRASFPDTERHRHPKRSPAAKPPPSDKEAVFPREDRAHTKERFQSETQSHFRPKKAEPRGRDKGITVKRTNDIGTRARYERLAPEELRNTQWQDKSPKYSEEDTKSQTKHDFAPPSPLDYDQRKGKRAAGSSSGHGVSYNIVDGRNRVDSDTRSPYAKGQTHRTKAHSNAQKTQGAYNRPSTNIITWED